MGVPVLYRWLVDKYPRVVVNIVGEDTNGLELDNFYLDMNGIIHPCFHPEDNLSPPTTFGDVYNNIYDYIDKLFNIVRPRKLLYMAIDGVAPRAKMNQQRVRRFKTSKDNQEAEEVEKQLRKKFEMENKKVLPKEESELSDSNVITPGTEFMYSLSQKLQSYIKRRMTTDSRWKAIKVILSDANVPGEGEHKIMSFIRAQRCCKDYNPETRHCLYGLDADLIMLALSTHEVHFFILREISKKPELVPESWHLESASGRGKSGGFNQGTEKPNKRLPIMKNSFEFLNVWILREYLEIDMNISDPPENFEVNLERLIDDFVFLCFFAGNDFLPHLPTLEIHERGIDLLIHVYKKEFKNLGGYLVDTQRIEDKKNGYMKMKRLKKFILAVGEYEERIFKKRSEVRDRKIKKFLSDYPHADDTDDHEFINANLQNNIGNSDCKFSGTKEEGEKYPLDEVLSNTRELKQKLKEHIDRQSDTFRSGIFADKVKLGAPQWRERYYEDKFSAKNDEDVERKRKDVVHKYVEGLCWVLKYYYAGVPSWGWFYPYHYGPFASDFKGISQVNVKFQKGLPFKPFDQLMGVLPPRSANALPEAYKKLMVDDSSKIIDFYPADFELDMNGKRFKWQAVCKLPFIQEERLLIETKMVERELKDHERQRNGVTADRLFAWWSSNLGEEISSFHRNYPSLTDKDAIPINSMLSDGLSGFMRLKLNGLAAVDFECEQKDQDVLCVFYEIPQCSLHKPHLLEGVKKPEKTITEADIVETELWHESIPQKRRDNRNYNLNSRSKNTAPNVTSKGPGNGIPWVAGRGKAIGGQEIPLSTSVAPTRNVEWRQGMVETGLWHESGRNIPQKRLGNLNHNLNSSSKSTAPNVMHKGPGNGIPWVAGRGRAMGGPEIRLSTSLASTRNSDWRQDKQTCAYAELGHNRAKNGPRWNPNHHARMQYQSFPSSPMRQQAHGRVKYVPKFSATNWNERDSCGGPATSGE